jgi:hypothetical protein
MSAENTRVSPNDLSEAYEKWWREQTRNGDPSRNLHLSRDAFYAGFKTAEQPQGHEPADDDYDIFDCQHDAWYLDCCKCMYELGKQEAAEQSNNTTAERIESRLGYLERDLHPKRSEDDERYDGYCKGVLETIGYVRAAIKRGASPMQCQDEIIQAQDEPDLHDGKTLRDLIRVYLSESEEARPGAEAFLMVLVGLNAPLTDADKTWAKNVIDRVTAAKRNA